VQSGVAQVGKPAHTTFVSDTLRVARFLAGVRKIQDILPTSRCSRTVLASGVFSGEPISQSAASCREDLTKIKKVASRKLQVQFCNGDLTPTQNLPVIEQGDLNPRNWLK
jgi:hypothetical protein